MTFNGRTIKLILKKKKKTKESLFMEGLVRKLKKYIIFYLNFIPDLLYFDHHKTCMSTNKKKMLQLIAYRCYRYRRQISELWLASIILQTQPRPYKAGQDPKPYDPLCTHSEKKPNLVSHRLQLGISYTNN